MTEESAKQMTLHKNERRYNPEKLANPSNGEAWTHFLYHELFPGMMWRLLIDDDFPGPSLT
jgi:hypothetical protein